MPDRKKIIGHLNDCMEASRRDNTWVFARKDIVEDAIAILKEQPEIVRCKDCVNCIKEPNGDLYCDVLAIGYEPLGSKRVTEVWYCADGERR